MTLKEIKDMTLMLMDSYTVDGAAIPETYNNRLDLLCRMPSVINTCQNYLSTTAAKIPAVYKIAQEPFANRIAGNMHKTIRFSGDDILLSGDGTPIGAYYFEVNGIASVAIEALQGEEWICVREEEIGVRPNGFAARRGLLTQPRQTRLRFRGTYPYSIRNACLYAECFQTADEIPPYSSERRYTMPGDFYQMDGNEVYFCDAGGVTKPATQYRIDNQTIVVPSGAEGEWIVHYFRYPAQIDDQTPEDFKLDNTLEALLCIPYYAASHLLRSDDPYRSQLLMNEFELMISRLNQDTAASIREIADVYPMGEGLS